MLLINVYDDSALIYSINCPQMFTFSLDSDLHFKDGYLFWFHLHPFSLYVAVLEHVKNKHAKTNLCIRELRESICASLGMHKERNVQVGEGRLKPDWLIRHTFQSDTLQTLTSMPNDYKNAVRGCMTRTIHASQTVRRFERCCFV